MPILPREPDLFPDDLLDSPDDSKWWVLYTMARREKELMRRLRGMEIPHYGPLAPRKSRSAGGRVRTSYVPLFAGYVFLRGDEEQRYQALTTNCISRVMEVVDTERLVRDLRQIKQLIESNAPLTPESRLQPGMRVRVRGGPLAGVEGVVVKRQGKDRLVVSVEFLQQGASVALEDYEAEPI
jgi:transcriptional antiterminator RfaH